MTETATLKPRTRRPAIPEHEMIRYISQFMPLSEAEAREIVKIMKVRSFKKGTVLLREGQVTKLCYFVLKGCIRQYFLVDGEEKTTNFYTEAESLNPLCVVTKKPSEYYVACVEDSILLVGNSDMESAIFEKFPRFETLCRILSDEWLAKNKAEFDAFKTSTPEKRYLDLLENRPDLLQRAPHYQLASYLGITPQSLSRLRSRIAKTGTG